MNNKEEWQKIEDLLDLIKRFTEVIGAILIDRNEENDVDTALKLGDPDIAWINHSLSLLMSEASEISLGHSDSIQVNQLEHYYGRFGVLKDLVSAMEDKDQIKVDEMIASMKKMEWAYDK